MLARPLSAMLLGLFGLTAVPSALAIGIGPIHESIAFGRPLDLQVPLRLDRGDPSPPGCFRVEAQAGGQRIPPGSLHVSLEGEAPVPGEARVRVRSDVPVLEPALTVHLSVGCAGPVSRQFVLFADPGASAPEITAAAPATKRAPAAAAAVVVAGAVSPRRAPGTAVHPARPRAAASATTESLRPVASQSTVAASMSRSTPQAADAMAQAAPALQITSPGPSPTLREAAAAGPEDAERRLAALEGELQALRIDAETHRAAERQMRSRAADADGLGATHGVLMALVGVLGLSVLVLGWRLRSLRQGPAAAGAAALRDAEEGELADFAGDRVDPASGDGPPRQTPTHRSARGAGQAETATPLTLEADPAPDHPGSVDELFDLEQEAEFFTLLGDDAAAIDLLERNIRRRGVTSPLLYLKQLQLHRQRDDREGFDSAARRFGRHFAADAPQWEAVGEEGHGLPGFPSAVAELQSLWSEPSRALDRIEALLFPGPRGALFDLATYKDLLTLYQVARIRQRMPDSGQADVDLHLPLAPDNVVAATLSPSIFDTLAMGAATAPMPAGAASQGSATDLDLDLSEPAPLDGPDSQATAERSTA